MNVSTKKFTVRKSISKSAVDKLNELVEKNYDASQEYREAAKNAVSPALTGFLNDISLHREQFAADLQHEIINLGAEPTDNGTEMDYGRRAWMSMNTALKEHQDSTVLNKCIAAERAALEDYSKILTETKFYPKTERLLKKQIMVVKNAFDRIEMLKQMVD